MKSLARAFAAAALVGVLAGCAGPVPKVDVSAEKIATVKTIAVIRTPEPKTYTVANFGHPGMLFGAIGGLVAAADQSAKQNELSAAFHQRQSAISSHLADEVAAQLRTAGFEVRVEEGPWEEADGKFNLKFENITSSADAVLVVSPTIVGFISPRMGSDYLPTMTAVATLVGKDRKEQLYRGFHSYGFQPKAEGWKSTAPKATFSDFQVLMADPNAAVHSLEDAGMAIARSVSADLKH